MAVEFRPYADPEHLPFDFGDGPGAAILIHGFPGTPAEMRPLARDLSGQGWRAAGILLPGFGPEIVDLSCYGRRDWIGAAEESWLSLRKSGEPAIVIGYSMGGAVALNLASLHPPDLLVLIAPFWHAPGVLPRLVPVLKWFVPEFYPFKDADFADAELLGMFQQIIPDADLEDPDVQDEIRTEISLSLRVIDEILRLGQDAYRRAKRIAVPTVVIQGADDPVVRPADTQKLVRRFPEDVAVYQEVAGTHDLIQNGSVSREAVSALVVGQVGRLR